MAHESSPVMLAALLLDPENARLGETQQTQQQVYAKLAAQQGKSLVALARDIVENGLDPTTLIAVVPTDDRRRRYKVMEGNRRVLALKALETPSIVGNALAAGEQKAFAALAAKYQEHPVEDVPAVIFDTEEEARHWIKLRHTGANEGAGLVAWDSNEINRWEDRHGGTGKGRNPAGQALDFYERITGRKPASGLATNLGRIVRNPDCRRSLGLELVKGELVAHYPAGEIRKGLEKIVSDLESHAIRVKDIYDAADQRNYVKKFKPSQLPDPSKKLKTPVALAELRATGRSRPAPLPAQKPRVKKRTPPPRTTVIPATCKINPTNPKLNTLYNELLQLDVNSYPNAAAILLRVFVEQSVEHYLDQNPAVRPARQSRPLTLADKLKLVATDLEKKGLIPNALRKVIERIAGAQGSVMSASTNAFNQYVHNYFAYAKPQEIFSSWDELQPFMEQVL